MLLSTVPKQAPKAVDRGLLIQRANDELVFVVRNVPVVSAPLSQVFSPACQRLTFTAHADRVVAEFVGLTQGPNAEHPGSPLRGEKSGYDFRPQIVGVFTDLAGPAPPGLNFSATVDTRYSSSPTPLKMIAMILGVVLTGPRSSRCTSSTPPTAPGTGASCRRGGGRSAAWTPWSSPCWCGGISSAPTPPTTATS